MASFDPKALKTNEWGVVGGAFIAFIGLFFHAYSVSIKGFGGGSVSGWHFFWLWAPVMLVLATAGAVVLKALKPEVIPPQVVAFIPILPFLVGVLAVIIELLRWLTYPSPGGALGVGVDSGASFGTYLVVIATIVFTVFAYRLFTSTGMKLQHLKYLLPKPGAKTPPAEPPADPAV
jgi:hypothetical protein